MALQYLPQIVREINERERARLESLKHSLESETNPYFVNDRKFLILNYQPLNTHVIHVGVA